MGAGALVLVLVGDLRAAMGDRSPFTGDKGVLILTLGRSVLTSFVMTESEPLSLSDDVCAFPPYSSPGVAMMSSELPELIEEDISRVAIGGVQAEERLRGKRV